MIEFFFFKQKLPYEMRISDWSSDVCSSDLFLGFTYCPDVCPTTLTQLAQAQKQWEALPESTRPRVLFVSVDPERDTPDRIGEYAHAFHRDTLAATADIPALEDFARSLSLVFMKVPAPEGAPADQIGRAHV